MSFPNSPRWNGHPAEPQYPAAQPTPPGTYQNYTPPAVPAPYPQASYPARIPAPGLSPAAPYGIDPVTNLAYSSKSKTTAGLLGIFLGWLGVGRFYTGHVGIGISQLIVTLFTFGLGAWWGFIDGIVMLAGNPRDSDGLPLR